MTTMYNSFFYKMAAAMIVQPVFPLHDPTRVTGFTTSSVPFGDLLENVFDESVRGIDCVLTASAGDLQSFTFHVYDGVAHASQSDTESGERESPFPPACSVLTEELTLFGGKGSTEYTLCLYASDDFVSTYATNNPRATTLFAVLIVIFTSIFFMLYDVAVRREFQTKRELLAAKRLFMRFVSHEVRTPLNAVYMGLKVMQAEIASTLGYTSVEQLEAKAAKQKNRRPSGSPPDPKSSLWELFHLTAEVLESTDTATAVL